MKQFLETGKIVALFGLRGELKINPWCDSPEFLAQLERLYFADGTEIKLEKARVQKNVVVAKLAGVETTEAAQAFIGRVVYMNRADVELEEGAYFVQDLLGVRVLHAITGEPYGEICEVTQTGAADLWHIRTKKGEELLFPAAAEFITEINLEGGVIRVCPPEGLFDAV